jgi:hypothetical protein
MGFVSLPLSCRLGGSASSQESLPSVIVKQRHRLRVDPSDRFQNATKHARDRTHTNRRIGCAAVLRTLVLRPFPFSFIG